MFTGLVDEIGLIDTVDVVAAGREFRIRCRFDDLSAGESIAVNGACLTAREVGSGWFTAAAVSTTLERTTMASWRAGTAVNLERALRAGDRLGGHLVQGHVDGVGEVRRVERGGDALLIDVAVGDELEVLVVPHGSVAIDGVSLTVHRLQGHGLIQVSIIDYTERHTTLGRLRATDRVHVEGDVIGKYVRGLLAPYGDLPGVR